MWIHVQANRRKAMMKLAFERMRPHKVKDGSKLVNTKQCIVSMWRNKNWPVMGI